MTVSVRATKPYITQKLKYELSVHDYHKNKIIVYSIAQLLVAEYHGKPTSSKIRVQLQEFIEMIPPTLKNL